MSEKPDVSVLRMGHRPGRDERMTTHVGLTARALGADRVVLANAARNRRDSIEEVTEHFGGPFSVDGTTDPVGTITGWEGTVVHLTMYGLPAQDHVADVRDRFEADSPLLIVVGAEKVPFEVYEHADWNLAVTNQPHSEVASLAVFLDRLFQGEELEQTWENAARRVVPMETGKRVEPVEDDE